MSNVIPLHGGHQRPLADRLAECRAFARLAFNPPEARMRIVMRDEALRLHRLVAQTMEPKR